MKRALKAKRLMDSFITTLERYGNKKKYFDDIHIDDICEDVGVSKVTLFKYFPNKEKLLLGWWQEWCNQVSGSLSTNRALSLLENQNPTLMAEVKAQMFRRDAKAFREAAAQVGIVVQPLLTTTK